MTLLAALSSILPVLTNQNFSDKLFFASVDLYSGYLFNASLIATFSAALPMALDTLLDFRLPLRDILPRYLIVLSLALPGLMTYIAYAVAGTSGAVPFAFVGLLAREILLRGALLSLLLYDGCSWKTVVTVGCVWVLTIFVIQSFLWRPFRPDIVTYSWYSICRGMSVGTALIVGVIVLHRWHKSMILSPKAKVDALYATFYPLLFTLNIVLKFIVLMVTYDLRNTGYVDMVICILATTIPGRQARHDKSIAEHIIKTKRDYVSYMSHEIRTPLNAVYMGIQLLTKEWDSVAQNCADFKGILDDVDASCKVAIDILNEFLLANKLEAGSVMLEKEYVSVVRLIQDVADPFGAQARQKEVCYTHTGSSRIDPDLSTYNIHVNADYRKISQVLRNLISNALKFTSKGGQVDVYAYLTKKASCSPENNVHRAVTGIRTSKVYDTSHELYSSVVRIEVRDNGVGISPVNQQKLFGEIVQFNAAQLQNGGGSGIGLWISKKIMDLHGGRIGVTSKPGEGSLFFVELDIASEATNQVFSATTPRQRTEKSFLPTCAICEQNSLSESDVKVLVVDDSAVNRKMLTRLIEPKVGHISQAENGLEAVDKVRESIDSDSPFDLIFMDATMPEMCGTDATALIRTMGYQGMIVFLTGNVTPEDIEGFMLSGANDVITKPCSLENVEDVLKKLLSEKMAFSKGYACTAVTTLDPHTGDIESLIE
eukprot:CAMPEP_0185037500 /NCGR_PEP_ID=MMETSP1103-20130426/32010_1 /TAXON_ID=36769 /ORGANISM="Paraphysomonas bandaiensis, Strain Caron Lab Isolate" /LENGTH=711 /DNA_ID=CAMNT_0027575499 /DNA_START=90 /DNA_END=2225 /DNA_ORIENTATION=-